MPKSHIQISLGYPLPLAHGIKISGPYTGAQTCQISPNLPGLLSLPPPPQVFCAAGTTYSLVEFCLIMPHTTRCSVRQAYKATYGCIQFLVVLVPVILLSLCLHYLHENRNSSLLVRVGTALKSVRMLPLEMRSETFIVLLFKPMLALFS